MTSDAAAPPTSDVPVEARETHPQGLSSAGVAERRRLGQTNAGGEQTSRSIPDILRANLLTRFNFILGTLLVVVLVVGDLQDALFGIVLVTNAAIGIAQELRAKLTLDRLAVLNAPRVRVVRDGEVRDIAVDDVVLDDLIELRTGDQVVADGVIRDSSNLQVDESLLTGEAEPVDKPVDAQLLSGSFAVAGSARYQATAVGADAYARRLTIAARRFSLARSDLVDGINRILKYVTWAFVPIAVLTLVSQLHSNSTVAAALISTVAALTAMVPQGLVLLTTIAFGVAAVTLARRRVLVQQLPAVEGLARVDVLCFDKTGTITDGSIAFDRLIRLDDAAPVEAALGALAADENRNATMAAVAARFHAVEGWRSVGAVAFSSARKWSAASFAEQGTWVIGAPEVVLDAGATAQLAQAADMAAAGLRVLVLARTTAPLDGEQLPRALQAVAFVLLAERLRTDAPDAVAYFTAQRVSLKMISGDSPHTVGAVAARAGVPGADQPFDARELPQDAQELGRVLEERSVFGRVTPDQKQTMIIALQQRGHTVGMTGDGVNDALALKRADIGIAMGSGAPATKAVAELVLLDGRFATLPGVVAEGRRVTANIERVANLFLTKTVWAAVMALVVAVLLTPFPFLPRHLTIIDTLTIGVPSFFLALAPNTRRYLRGFVARVLRFAIPAGIIVAATTLTVYSIARANALPLTQQRTAATIATLMLSLAVLVLLAMPLTWRRLLLLTAVVGAFVLLFPLRAVRTFYALELPRGGLGITVVLGCAGIAVLAAFWFGSALAGRAPVRTERHSPP